MKTEEFFEAIAMLEKEKKISAAILCEKIGDALSSSVSGSVWEIDPEKKEIRSYVTKRVVDEFSDRSAFEILTSQAQEYLPGAVAGDTVKVPLDTDDFSRISASKAKNVIRQVIREAERNQLKMEYKRKTNELVTVKVLSVDSATGNAIVEMGRGECLLPASEQIPGETLRVGDLVKVYVVDIKDNEKSNVRAVISRKHPGLVRRLFEEEVPEIFDGTVVIKSISREAGQRTKIAVESMNSSVEAVGACIGEKGIRVETIVKLLDGEKIDVVKYSDKPEEFIAAALSPANVLEVEVLDASARMCSVTVPDNQLSLAIGKEGQNARLAARLTGWKIDIKPESGYYIPESTD